MLPLAALWRPASTSPPPSPGMTARSRASRSSSRRQSSTNMTLTSPPPAAAPRSPIMCARYASAPPPSSGRRLVTMTSAPGSRDRVSAMSRRTPFSWHFGTSEPLKASAWAMERPSSSASTSSTTRRRLPPAGGSTCARISRGRASSSRDASCRSFSASSSFEGVTPSKCSPSSPGNAAWSWYPRVRTALTGSCLAASLCLVKWCSTTGKASPSPSLQAAARSTKAVDTVDLPLPAPPWSHSTRHSFALLRSPIQRSTGPRSTCPSPSWRCCMSGAKKSGSSASSALTSRLTRTTPPSPSLASTLAMIISLSAAEKAWHSRRSRSRTTPSHLSRGSASLP
mmetsp:Transcript_66499/g.210514  ORF Transcript_66499/g.210514 Transcript_66499/m.210514 type:complete len:340 (-) Transcript_66499:267-1286(-)